MIGGIVVQVLDDAVEVLDTTYFDRCWRRVDSSADVRVGDELWWQSFVGYLTRDGAAGFRDKNIGECRPASLEQVRSGA